MTEMQKKKTLGIAILSLIFGCFFIIPFLGAIFGIAAIVLGIVALVKISNNKKTLKGKGLAISGITLGAISIFIIPILALFTAIAIPNFLRARLTANEAVAEVSVKTISTAIEVYSESNNGIYPTDESELVYASPPYLDRPYNNRIISGYSYSIRLNPDSYQIIAEPDECGVTGRNIFIISETGEISKMECE